MKTNCWEFHNCGRQPGGHMVQDLGVCLTPLSKSYKGANDGLNGGRCCWRVAGSLYGGHADCVKLEGNKTCDTCDFYQTVKREQGEEFVS
jgi:hypothetical protein